MEKYYGLFGRSEKFLTEELNRFFLLIGNEVGVRIITGFGAKINSADP